MKGISALVFILIFSRGFSQAPSPNPIVIGSYPVQAAMGKTTNIIFPYPLKSVDRGSMDLLVQKAKGVENILQLKADRINFQSTNLTVVTTDGKFYSFIVSFSTDPKPLNLSFCKDTSATLTGRLLNDEVLDSIRDRICKAKPFLHVSHAEDGITIHLAGAYFCQHLLWLDFTVTNLTPADFSPTFTRFVLVDRHRARRTAIHETSITPFYQTPLKTVPANSCQEVVFAFEPFRVTKDQRLEFQMSGENDGSSPWLRISHRVLKKSRSSLD